MQASRWCRRDHNAIRDNAAPACMNPRLPRISRESVMTTPFLATRIAEGELRRPAKI
jgi:hypothetical protein